jgi:hypothetical protein
MGVQENDVAGRGRKGDSIQRESFGDIVSPETRSMRPGHDQQATILDGSLADRNPGVDDLAVGRIRKHVGRVRVPDRRCPGGEAPNGAARGQTLVC